MKTFSKLVGYILGGAIAIGIVVIPILLIIVIIKFLLGLI